MSNRYNADASAWNSTWSEEFAGVPFSVQLSALTYLLKENTTQYGAFSPYHDSCDINYGPSCISSTALFYEASVPIISNNSFPFVLYSSSSSFYNRTIPVMEHWILSKKTIGCDGGSKYTSENEFTARTTCTLRCSTVGGHWNTSDYSCHVTGYLSSICLRVRKSANTSQWVIDIPPLLHLPTFTRSFQSLAGDQVAEGCAYRAADNLLNYVRNTRWEPLLYTPRPCDDLHISVRPLRRSHSQVRHAADATIRADSITRGCSGNAEGDARCFGKGKGQYQWVMWLAMSVGCVTLVLEAVGGVMYCRGQFSLEYLGELFAHHPSSGRAGAV